MVCTLLHLAQFLLQFKLLPLQLCNFPLEALLLELVLFSHHVVLCERNVAGGHSFSYMIVVIVMMGLFFGKLLLQLGGREALVDAAIGICFAFLSGMLLRNFQSHPFGLGLTTRLLVFVLL